MMTTQDEFLRDRALFLEELRLLAKNLKILADGLPNDLGYAQYIEIVGKLKEYDKTLHKLT